MTLVATQVKRRRGTNDENDAFAGAEGEITVDLTNKELRVHDGSGKTGGFRIGRHTDRTNCITECSQDIILELNNGTLILKAGSILTDPQGGTQRTITEDKTGTLTINGQYMVFADRYTGELQLGLGYTVAKIGSGSALPADGSTFNVFYNSTDEKIYRWNNLAWVFWSVALPIGIITVSGGAISSIDQVFNGFGYMGSSWFLLPKLKGLIPDKFNADGTLKNIKVVVNNLVVKTMIGGSNQKKITLGISATGNIVSAGSYKYIESENINTDNNIHWHGVAIAEFDNTNGKISRAVLKKTFQAVDYSDYIRNFGTVIEEGLPTADNNYTWYRKYAGGWVEQGRYFTNSTTIQYGSQGNLGSFYFPIPMQNSNFFATASCKGYCVLVQEDKSTTYYKPIFGTYTTERTLSNVSVYVCGLYAQ